MKKRKEKVDPWAYFPWAAALVLYGFFAFYLHAVHAPVGESEPDQYFHLAIGQRTAEQGFVRSLPQAADIAWGSRYTNDYFLFSGLVAGAWWLGGETAAKTLVPVLATVLLLLLFAISRRYLDWRLALALPLGLLFQPASLNRLITLRPSLLASCLLVGLVLSLLRRNRWGVVLCCAGFSLAYHAFYFPLFVLAVAAVLGVRSGNGWARDAAWGLGGLLVGICLNPSFPASLSTTAAVWDRVLVPAALPEAHRALENQGWSMDQVLGRLAFWSFLLGLGAWQLGMASVGKKRDGVWHSAEFLLLFVPAIAFTAALLLSYRTMEYVGPFCTVVAAYVLAHVFPNRREAACVLAAGAFLALPGASLVLQNPLPVILDPKAIRQVTIALPHHTDDKKVFNCDWSIGSPLLFRRPDLRFVDLGDPLAIEKVRPGYASLKSKIAMGTVPDPYQPIRGAFQSDYVLCSAGVLSAQMERSPDFRRVYPPVENQRLLAGGIPTIYAARTERHPAFVNWDRPAGAPSSVYLDFPSSSRAVSSERCEKILPPRGELDRLRGARYLGIGGGPRVNVQWNGKTLFHREKWEREMTLDTLVPLPRPLAPSDRFEVTVCASEEKAMGVAVSFWSRRDLEEVCRWKGLPTEHGKTSGAAYADELAGFCVAPVAPAL